MLDDKKANAKRPASSTSTNSSKKQKSSAAEFFQPTIDKFLVQKEPVLALCGALVVENGLPFKCFNSDSMQVMIDLGKKGAGDTSGGVIKAPRVRDKVQEEASKLRKELKLSMVDKVLSLSTDMASSNGRCFLGKKF